MRRPLRLALWVIGIGAAILIVIGGLVALVVWNSTTISRPNPAEAEAAFARMHERFKGRVCRSWRSRIPVLS